MRSGVWDPNLAGIQRVFLVLPPAWLPISLGAGDACGLAAWLGRVVSAVQLALVIESGPGLGDRAELQETGPGVRAAVSVVGSLCHISKLGVRSVQGCRTFLGRSRGAGLGWDRSVPGERLRSGCMPRAGG